jgi:hypoxanthine phosphoribosyltransferase
MSTKPYTRGDAGLTLLFSRETLAARVRELGEQISRDLADLMRTLEVQAQVEFVRLASYGTGKTSAGQVRLTLDLEVPIAGQDVLIVEDILDTGLTLSILLQQLLARQPTSLKLCVLLDKRIGRTHEIAPDYVGFEVPDGFVVGYGIGYAERYRHLAAIHALTIPASRS